MTILLGHITEFSYQEELSVGAGRREAGAQCRSREKRKNKRRGTYHLLPNKASSNGPVVTHTQQQFWKAGDLEQEHVLQTGRREREGDKERYQ